MKYLTLGSLVIAFAVLRSGTPMAQTLAAVSACDAARAPLPALSLLAVQAGRLAPGESTCFALRLRQGERARIWIGAEVGYVRARIIDPRGNQLQVTWASSFATAAPSLPLVLQAPQSGLYAVELSVPKWVPFVEAQSFHVQLVEWQPASVGTARHQALQQDARVTWLRDHAQRVRSINPNDPDFSDLQFLSDLLRYTRVVVLGEGDNGGGSDVLAKTRLVKFLHERMGFDVIAFQAGIHSSTASWRALQQGTDPRDAMLKSVFGVLARSAQAETLIQYLAARAKTDRPLELTGFDGQFTGSAAATFVPDFQAFLAERRIASPFADNEALPTRVLAGTIAGKFGTGASLPSPLEQAETVEALRAAAADIERRAPDRDGARWAQILRSTAVQIGLALHNARGAGAGDYMNGLARQIADNVKWLVSHAYPDRKIIVWTHTTHAMRGRHARGRVSSVDYSLGDALWDILGARSFTIALTSYNGRSHQVTAAEDYYQDLIPDQHPSIDFETLMNAAGHELAFVNLRSARARGDWLGGRFVARPLYLIPEEAEWSGALDALLFIRTQEPRTR